MTTKINFKQPKYIFPLVIFVPLCAMIYFVMQTFGAGSGKKPTVATDRINMNLSEAQAEETGDKLFEMSRRFDEEDAFTAVGSLGDDDKDSMQIEHGYSEEELNRIDAAEAETYAPNSPLFLPVERLKTFFRCKSKISRACGDRFSFFFANFATVRHDRLYLSMSQEQEKKE